MPALRWKAYEDGMTLGRAGSAGGRVLRDEDCDNAARITLERDCPDALFAITCSVYGWMQHTVFYDNLDAAETDYTRMKQGLADIAALIPDVNAPDIDARLRRVAAAVSAFMATYTSK